MERDGKKSYVLSLMNEDAAAPAAGARLWDPAEFLCPHGLRSLSKAHQAQPFAFGGPRWATSRRSRSSKIKGGNSNWRGPIWFPTSFLLIESLRKLGTAYGRRSRDAAGRAPVRSGEMARRFADRLIRSSCATRRPPAGHGEQRMFQEDPHWRDLLLFYEYFHGDTGQGLGASHQTGWTALVATLIDEWRRTVRPSRARSGAE